jgi:hypothetical protein
MSINKPYINKTNALQIRSFWVELIKPLFLNHKLFTYCTASHSCAPPISTIESIKSPPTACPAEGIQNSLHYTFTLKIATAVFAEMLDNTQPSTSISQSYTLHADSLLNMSDITSMFHSVTTFITVDLTQYFIHICRYSYDKSLHEISNA